MTGLPAPHGRLPIAVAAAFLLILLSTMLVAAARGGEQDRAASPRPSGLTAFRSDAELRTYLRRRRHAERRFDALPAAPAMIAPAPAPPPAQAASNAEQAVVVTGARAQTPGITNNQEANVDEGDIVKMAGKHLIILRRGRLFSVAVADGGLRPVATINAFPPGVDGSNDWYDEMLVHGDRIVVVGYSYARGGTEINRFRIDEGGRLSFEDAYDLRSNDYYSSRNYASRLIGNRLIFYTPLYLDWEGDPLEALPAIRRWTRNGERRPFRRIASARSVYVPPSIRDRRDVEIDTLHTVTSCDLEAAELACSATGVLGPGSRNFYVSGRAVYLWLTDYWNGERPRRLPPSLLYRMPLDATAPSAIGTRGAPVDQFSFREDADQGLLNVLVRSEQGGDAMWRPEVSEGDAALLRLPLRLLGDGSQEAPLAYYRPLPRAGGADWSFHNRFVGGHLLYGGGEYGGSADGRSRRVFVVPLRGGPVAQLPLAHAVERLEAIGQDAMVIGAGQAGLGFSTVELGSVRPRLGDSYSHRDAAEGETRSHAFFFSPDANSADGASGTIGLPVARKADPALERFFGSSAALLFLRREARRLSPAGELEARQQGVTDDGCTASCVDWYGNARPIFLGNRTFALLGYELVEGRIERGRIRELRRVSFAPAGGRTAP